MADIYVVSLETQDESEPICYFKNKAGATDFVVSWTSRAMEMVATNIDEFIKRMMQYLQDLEEWVDARNERGLYDISESDMEEFFLGEIDRLYSQFRKEFVSMFKMYPKWLQRDFAQLVPVEGNQTEAEVKRKEMLTTSPFTTHYLLTINMIPEG